MTHDMNQDALVTALGLLVCPRCRGDLTREGTDLICPGCAGRYSQQDRIPLLARSGSSEQWGGPSEGASSIAYQEAFLEPGIGERYRSRYQQRWFKRCTTRREIGRIGRLLAFQSRCARLLDIPCGGGRVSGPLAGATDLLLQADLSLDQVLMARRTMGARGHIAWFTASAFMIPLKDGAVDGTICNRLMHHLPSGAEQERLIHELLRVSARFVILSYYDHDSVKSLGRRVRGKHPGHTLRRRDLRAWAERGGAFVRADIPLWCGGSRLRYALLQKSAG